MPSTTQDILQEIPSNNLEYFCEAILKRDWPQSIHVYYFVKTIMKWRTVKFNLNVLLLSVENDIEDGTFVGIMNFDRGGSNIIVYTQEQSCERLSRALRYTERINWSANPLFEAVLQKHTDVIHSTLATIGVRTSVYCQSGILYMDNGAAEQVDPSGPEDVFLSSLGTQHVPYIYSVWAHKDIYTSSELEDTLRLNGGFGVFSPNDELPLAWVMHTHYGGVGVLQRRSDQLKKGYGTLVTKGITHALGKLGIDPHACIMDENSKSLSLFKSIGYKRVSDIQYISTSLSVTKS